MPSPTISNDYWSNEFDPGTSATWAFSGADGLARRSGAGWFSAAVPRSFSSKLTRVQLDHVALEVEQATPHRYRSGPADADSSRLVTFLLLTDGRLGFQNRGDGSGFELEERECALLDSSVPVDYSAEVDTWALRAVVGIEHLPPYLQKLVPEIVGPVARTNLVEGFIAVAATILRDTGSGKRAHGDHLVQAVADLLSAIVAEAGSTPSHELGTAGMRIRIEEHISAHLADPGLSPGSVADALGISVRQAHTVFNSGDRTIARFIRERRAVAVAAELRADSRTPRLQHLAEQHGFTDADLLTRAFRTLFGTTPTQYWRDGYRHFGDTPLDRTDD